MIQGTSSGAGKSTIVIGLCRILSDLGYQVAPFKAQNMSSHVHRIKTNTKNEEIALAQAIQARACRVQPNSKMNPILLKPQDNYRSKVMLNGYFYSELNAKQYYETFALQRGFPAAIESLEDLGNENEIVVIEGAGSPAEVNISKYDISNMLIAYRFKAPVLIVADIERGGCFASLVGTMRLLSPQHRKLVRGFLINKFRGDVSILDSAIARVEGITRKKILGIIPMIQFRLPQEDSLDIHVGPRISPAKWDSEIDFIANSLKTEISITDIVENIAGLHRR
jgi:adenosylcobyric acid synthase